MATVRNSVSVGNNSQLTEEQAIQQFIHEIRKNPSLSNDCLIGDDSQQARLFLAARKYDLARALVLYKKHQEIRRLEGLLSIDPWEPDVRHELVSEKFTVLTGRDSKGAAVALFAAKNHFPTKVHRHTLRALVYQLDCALSNPETQRNGLVFVYDMTGSKYANFDYDLSIKILEMLKGGYPARLKKVLIVTAPLWFKAPFNVMRLFLKEKLRDRVHTVGRVELLQHLSSSILPQRLSGTSHHSHTEWLSTCLRLSAHHDTPGRPYHTFCNVPAQALDGVRGKKFGEPTARTHSTTGAGGSGMPGSGGAASRGTKRSSTNAKQTPPAKVCKGPTRTSSLTVSKAASSTAVPSLHQRSDAGQELRSFLDHVQDSGRQGLLLEYDVIRNQPPDGTFECARLNENLDRNRYTDVPAFDDTRVILKTAPGYDYINGNYVDGYKQPKAYICTQGSMPSTFEDFWRMVWEQHTLVLVMTTRCVERGRLKCGQYWPREVGEEGQFGQFMVSCHHVENCDTYLVSKLRLRDTQTGEVRSITHFQFVSWPDFGVPESAVSFLAFRESVRVCQEEMLTQISPKWSGHPRGPPIILHCSAGIGRTGTFCTMDISLLRLEDTGSVCVLDTVRKMRTQRAFSIQTGEQYVFCHLALLEHAVNVNLLAENLLEGFWSSDGPNSSL